MCVLLLFTVVANTGCTSKQVISLIQEAADNGCEITSAERRSNLERVRCK